MLLPIEANQVKQDFEPLLGRKAEVVGTVGGIGLGVAIEPADDTLHGTIVSLAGYASITLRMWTYYD
jgi:hypothetical protein